MSKILIDRSVVEQALEALDKIIHNSLALVQLASVANSFRAALEQEEQETNPWRDAVDRELTTLHMFASDDPRESIHRLIGWHCAEQIDPLVSSAARDLIERGKREALEPCADESDCPHIPWCRNRVDCQRAALKQPEQEPVAWLTDVQTMYFDKEDARRDCDGFIQPLYTHPPREWVGLKEGEIHDLSVTMVKGDKSVNWLIGTLEAKLKE